MKLLAGARIEPFVITLTFAWVVGLFAASTAPLQDLWRPLVACLVIALLLAVVASSARPATRWPVIGVGGAWLLALGAWPLALVVLLVAVWRLLVDRLRARQGRRSVAEPADAQVVRVLNALGLAGVIVATVSVATSGAIGSGSTASAPDLEPTTDAPSIYAVLLDGYPATETLAGRFSFDNAPFEAELAERGFDVTLGPRSNYNRTLLTLSSMLHMRYIDDVPGLAPARGGFAAQNRQLTASLNAAPVPRMLRDAGYRTVSISSSYGEAALTTVDQPIHPPAMTLFEEQFLRFTAVGNWLISAAPELVAGQHRDAVLGAIEALERVPEDTDSPTFAFAHVFSPHAPFVFNADGSERAVQACYPSRCGLTTPEADRIGLDAAAYGEGLVGQVRYLNQLLLDAVDRILAEDPDAVIVLFSDHGARYEQGPTAEHFAVFLAARTPGHPGLLGEAPSLVNTFPSLFNAYFGADLPLLPYRAAWAPDDAPLDAVPMEPMP